MSSLISMVETRGWRQAAQDEAVALLIGGVFTLALFVGMAHFENFGAVEPVTEIEDLRLAAIPLEPPPPPPKLERIEEIPEAVLPFSGLEVGASESPVSIAVVPPDLESFIPTSATPPRARIQFGLLHTDFKPKVDIETDPRHIYQDTEVDQRPRGLVRTAPPIPSDVSGRAASMRVGLLLLIGVNGKAESVRVTESSGNPRFDTIVADTVKNEWVFSPAVRRGKKVRVLAQQPFRIVFNSNSSPFSVAP